MHYDDLIGRRIEIKRINKEKHERYSSQILDIIDDKTYIISGPIKKKNIVIFHVGEIIEISYIVEDKGRFYFNAKILQRFLKDIYSLKVLRTTNINKLQERDYYRLNVSLNVVKTYCKKTHLGVENIEEKCESVDLSGGGIKLKCNYPHSIGDNVKILLDIGDLKIPIDGEVVRIQEKDFYGYKYLIGIKFNNVSNKDRDLIIRYIFQEQRRLRNKGLI